MISKNFQAHAALLTANLIYGINYSLAKNVMPEYIQPSGFILLRVGGAALLFWLLSLFTSNKETINKSDFKRIAISAVFGVTVNQLLFFQGLNITSPIHGAIIMTSNPILVMIIASIYLRERIHKLKVLGIATGFSGALLLILYQASISGTLENSDGSSSLGDFLIFLNALSYGIYLVLVKPLLQNYSAQVVIKWVFTIGFFFVLPFGWSEFAAVEWHTFTPTAIFSAAFVVIGTTFLAYLFNVFALKQLSPSSVSIYIYSQPVFAAIFATLTGHDTIDWVKLVSAALIFIGVYLVSKPLKSTS